MTSSPVAPAGLPSANWLPPDHLADAAAQFAVEWQVVERMQPFPAASHVEGWELS